MKYVVWIVSERYNKIPRTVSIVFGHTKWNTDCILQTDGVYFCLLNILPAKHSLLFKSREFFPRYSVGWLSEELKVFGDVDSIAKHKKHF